MHAYVLYELIVSIVCEAKSRCVEETTFEVKGPGVIPFVAFSFDK